MRSTALHPLLARLESRGAPLLVHPGPGVAAGAYGAVAQASLEDPLWWPALTSYVATMQAAWLAFLTAGRARHPRLRVVFSMLAGLAPLQAERLSCRGGPSHPLLDPLIFYEISSYGPLGGRGDRGGGRPRAAALRLRPSGRRAGRARDAGRARLGPGRSTAPAARSARSRRRSAR